MGISRRHFLWRLAAGAAALRIAAPAIPGGAHSKIRLSSTQNAYGPSAKVIAAIREAQRSPSADPKVETDKLRDAIAALHNVTPAHVVLGSGSTEIMRASVKSFASREKPLVAAQPTYDAIFTCAERANAEVLSVGLASNYAHDLAAMLPLSKGAGLVYICNPNNPTGTLVRRGDLESFLELLPPTTKVLIDEAYHHYVGDSSDYVSFADRQLDDDRVIVMRSFSKVHGLAGLPTGYAITNPKTARSLASALPAEISAVAAKAAVAALNDTEHVAISAQRNFDDRQEFLNQANARMLRSIDSHTNFVMLHTGRPASGVIAHFRTNNIELPELFPPYDQHIRVSLGTQAEMMEFWRVWDLMPVYKMVM
jgi:histidinol-phosphate aminotransferase